MCVLHNLRLFQKCQNDYRVPKSTWNDSKIWQWKREKQGENREWNRGGNRKITTNPSTNKVTRILAHIWNTLQVWTNGRARTKTVEKRTENKANRDEAGTWKHMNAFFGPGSNVTKIQIFYKFTSPLPYLNFSIFE